jgi:hypothetical protein
MQSEAGPLKGSVKTPQKILKSSNFEAVAPWELTFLYHVTALAAYKPHKNLSLHPSRIPQA